MKFEKLTELIEERITGEWGQEPDSPGVKVIRTTNFTNEGKIDLSNVVERDIDEKKIEKKALRKGDIIIEKSGGGPTQPVGRVVFFDVDSDEKYLCNNFTAILRPNNSIVHSKYLLYQMLYLHKTGRTKKYQNKTTGIHNLNLEKYLQEKIALPSLPDQLHIANLLTKAAYLIAQRKESIRLLDEFLKSTFLEMFGDPVRNDKKWKVISFNDVGKFKNGGTPSKSRSDFWEGDFPWVSPKDMKVSKIVDSKDHISELVFNETTLKRIPRNHLLIVVRGMILAHSFPIAINETEVAINQDMKAIQPISELNIVFLQHCLNAMKRQILDLMSSAGHGTRKFDTCAMQKLLIPVPSDTFQNQFAQIVEKTEILKTQYLQSLKELENLYGSLSQKAFKGELSIKNHANP